MNCETCRFWEETESGDEHTVSKGECRRRSPTLVLEQLPVTHKDFTSVRGEEPDPDEFRETTTYRIWPMTYCYDWCGEFEPSPPPPASAPALPATPP